MNGITENIVRIQEELHALTAHNGIGQSVKLCAATKMRSIEEIQSAVSAGIDGIGENKIQEARDKYPHITGAAKKHFIGHLQTNKVKYCPDLFDCVQSVDSITLLDALERTALAAHKTLDYMIEVNISGEESKFGVRPDALAVFFERARSLHAMRLVGFMTMLPFTDDRKELRRYADEMHRLFHDSKKHNTGMILISELSMGMSQDYALCVEAGSTMVRIGTKIFGERAVL